MKRLLQRSPVIDPSLARSLEIIDRFDELVDESATLADLAAEAAAMTGLRVGVCDLPGSQIVAFPEADAVRARDAVDALHRHGVRGRRVELVALAGEQSLVASIDLAHGRVGVVWLSGDDIDDTAYLVAERLAAAAAVTVLRAPEPTRGVGQAGAELLTSLLDEAEAEQLGAELRLAPGVARVVVLARVMKPSLLSPTALGQALARHLGTCGTAVTVMTIGGDAAIVCADDSRLAGWLSTAVVELAKVGVLVEIGIGSAGRLQQLRDSWLQARDALSCCGLLETPVLRSCEAGALSLLRRVPGDLVLADRDVQRVRALSADDRDLLRSFLVTGSLRAAAAQVHLHHTSVRYRLTRISEATGLDVLQPVVQHRLFVALAMLATAEREWLATEQPEPMRPEPVHHP